MDAIYIGLIGRLNFVVEPWREKCNMHIIVIAVSTGENKICHSSLVLVFENGRQKFFRYENFCLLQENTYTYTLKLADLRVLKCLTTCSLCDKSFVGYRYLTRLLLLVDYCVHCPIAIPKWCKAV